MTKWYIKLFKRLLNSAVLNSFLVYRQVTGRIIQQLSYRIQLVECLFTKFARAAKMQNEPGRQASDKSVPQLTENIFWQKWHPKLKNWNHGGSFIYAQMTETRKLQCTAAKYATWVFAWSTSLSCITRSSISELMTITLLHLYSFKISQVKF